jgi:hypothetical protein
MPFFQRKINIFTKDLLKVQNIEKD